MSKTDSFDIIRFDYFPARQQDVSGADILKLDLGELEAARLNNLKQLVPVKCSYSLAQDFPLAYGQFKKTGRCKFQTTELPLQLAYPGLYGYRIRAVDLEVVSASPTVKPRGLLINPGFSLLSRADGTTHPSVRFPESVPFSDFRLRTDMTVQSMPGECLFNFEGGGIDTFWELEFAPQANVCGLEQVVDVLITCDLRANYSAELHKIQRAALPSQVHNLQFVSAVKFQPEAITELQKGKGPATVVFDLAKISLPGQGYTQTINNLIVLITGADGETLHAQLHCDSAPTPIDLTLVDGSAFSTAPPLTNTKNGPSPLDALLGKKAGQAFTLVINPAANPGVAFDQIRDVILGVDYIIEYGTASNTTERLIREKAYQLWIERGRRNGFAKDDWFDAKQALAA